MARVVARKGIFEKLITVFFPTHTHTHTQEDYARNVYEYYFGVPDRLNDGDDDDDEVKTTEGGPRTSHKAIRNFRPPHVEFRVGEVILTRNLVVGVIIGWDIDVRVSRARAPRTNIKRVHTHPSEDLKSKREMSVL